jgi:hypothetical protein
LKDHFNPFNEPSTEKSTKFKTNTSDESLWYSDMNNQNEEDKILISHPEHEDFEMVEQSIIKYEKILETRLKSKSYETTSLL